MRKVAVLVYGAITWLFVIYTLIAVGRYGGAVLFDLSTTSRIMAVRNGDVIHSAIGLTWHGLPGAVLVVLELVLVAGAMVLSLNKAVGKRRIGGVILILWALLWLGNSIWMETLMAWRHVTTTSLLFVATLAVATWVGLRWGTMDG